MKRESKRKEKDCFSVSVPLFSFLFLLVDGVHRKEGAMKMAITQNNDNGGKKDRNQGNSTNNYGEDKFLLLNLHLHLPCFILLHLAFFFFFLHLPCFILLFAASSCFFFLFFYASLLGYQWEQWPSQGVRDVASQSQRQHAQQHQH